MPSDALGDASEYAETYDETKLIRYQREQSEMKHKVEEVIIDTRNANAYFVLEKEESESKQEDDNYNIGAIDKDDGTQDKLKRVSSYEDTDNCIQGAKRSEKIDDSGYEITSGVKKELNKNRPANLERNNLFAKGLDHIPDSIQRKLGIRFVSGDYSEYYAYKLLRRNSTDCPHCENKDLCESSYESFGHLPKSTLDADISEENNDSINEYDKLHYFARNDSKQQNRYDRVLGNFIKGGTLGNQVISGTARYEKRSNSI